MKVKSIDIVFITVLALSSLVSLLLHFVSGYVLSINDYAGFLLLAVVLFFHVYRKDKFGSGLFILLVLGSFSIIGFSFVAFNSTFVHITDDITYNPPGFNPVLFLMLVVYSFINFNYIRKFLGGSKEENGLADEKMTDFYYNKFSDCDAGEFRDIAKRIDAYPAEAQAAIQRVMDERNI